MSVTAVVGANWGDEGKGKTTDFLAAESDFVVRYQGGNNAGHTIINEYGKFALHLLPSGVFYSHIINVLGPGVAVNIRALKKEIQALKDKSVPEPDLKVSSRAQVVMPYHILFDQLEEERLADKKFGSTKSGIAPFYSDKYLKLGIQIGDLFYKDRLVERLESSVTAKNVLLERLYHKKKIVIDRVVAEMESLKVEISPFVCDTTELLHKAIRNEKKILLEGQLGALRDPDHGIYPYPTSSSTLAGFASVGAGIAPHAINRVVAVVKAYSSCVGAGPFVTELSGDEAENLRSRGGDAGEYGATTGRPRRVGWFDAVATAYGCMVQGATEVALTNLDVLGYLDEIPVCDKYSIEGKESSIFPIPALLDSVKGVFKYFPGWKTDISEVRNYENLPPQAKDYIGYIEERVGVPISIISIGPRREQIILRNS